MSQLPPQSVFFGLAILLSLVAVVGLARRAAADIALVFSLFSLAAVAAVVGARVLWVFASPEAGWSTALRHPELIWHPLRGGFASLGGWAGATCVLTLATRDWSRARRWRLADLIAPAGLFGMAMARLGCLSNGCDYGVTQAWGIRYAPGMPAYHRQVEQGLVAAGASESLPTFPLPVLLAGATFLIAAAAFGLIRRVGVGKTAVGSCGAYFGVRLALEFFRAPETVEVVAGPFNVNHVFAGLGLLATVAAWRFFQPQAAAGPED